MPREEIEKPQEQIAAGAESPGPGGGGPYRGFDPFIQYVLHRLDSIEASLRGEIKQLEGKVDAKIEQLDAKIDDKIEQMGARLDDKIGKLENKIDRLHGEIHWLIGIVIGAAGLAVAIVAWLSQAR
jgi:tetrahydromethanopterin S-methyltransferase subunit G